MKKLVSSTLVAVLLFMSIPATALATWSEAQSFRGSDTVEGDYFGSAVAFSGNYLLAGSFLDVYDSFPNAGSAFFFELSGGTWGSENKKSESPATNDFFGYAVDIDESYAVVGEYGDGDNVGQVFVYKQGTGNNWTLEETLVGSDASTSDQYGKSVAIDGNYLVVGQPGDGRVYLYETDDGGLSWTEKDKIEKTLNNDVFGGAVDISGTTVVVGEPENDDVAADAGAAYIYTIGTNDTLDGEVKITGADIAAGDGFSNDVSVASNYIIVGARLDNEPSGDEGSAYVFTPTTGGDTNAWDTGSTDQQQKLTADDAAASDNFGMSVKINGTHAIIGSPYNTNAKGTQAGAAYMFERSGSTWSQTQKYIASDGTSYDLFGWDADISPSGGSFVTSQYMDSSGGTIYYFTEDVGGGEVPEFSSYVFIMTALILLVAAKSSSEKLQLRV